ncbi:hypothetical protein [Acutalibacter caecimuris]|uniref:hypothetical protein n=1 Tax=Acutalibacter caecimuris TaxID=3093657 RepID=UPI002AC95D05|nr:hypothetical protein [Acutalibacter sp. M00118]
MYTYTQESIQPIFTKWRSRLRLEEGWDVKLELVDDPAFTKTGDFKIDPTDRKAILLLNARNPRQENPEEVICHELLHLKLYPLDQLTETLIDSHYQQGTPAYSALYTQFMVMLETTVEEMAKCWLSAFGEDKALSYGRCREMKSFNQLYDGLKSL